MKTTFKQSTLFINQHVITNAINNSKTDMIVWYNSLHVNII